MMNKGWPVAMGMAEPVHVGAANQAGRFRRRLVSAIAGLGLSMATGLASAWTVDEWPRTVAQVGVHGTSTSGFMSLMEGVSPNCVYGQLYFDVGTPLGKAMLAVLTTAKATGQKVRVGYAPTATPSACTLELVALV